MMNMILMKMMRFLPEGQMDRFSLYTANVLLAAIAYCADQFHCSPFFSTAKVLADLRGGVKKGKLVFFDF
jgi:hypothetical protein